MYLQKKISATDISNFDKAGNTLLSLNIAKSFIQSKNKKKKKTVKY